MFAARRRAGRSPAADVPGEDFYVEAACADFTTNIGNYAYGNGTGSPISGNIPSTNVGNVVCGLSEFNGQMTTSSNGVAIGYNATTTYWTWTFGPESGANAQCVK